MMRTAYRIASLGLLVALLGLLGLVLASPLYVSAPTPPPQTDCKVWSVQLGPIVFAIPHDSRIRILSVRVGEGSKGFGRLHEFTRCDEAPLTVEGLYFRFEGLLMRRGALPEGLDLIFPPAVNVKSRMYEVDPSRIKARCGDGFDTGINQLSSQLPIFGCRRDSGRLLVWNCAFTNSSHNLCNVTENYGSITVRYYWYRQYLSHEKTAQLDDSIIDYLNSMIVSGEKLPH